MVSAISVFHCTYKFNYLKSYLKGQALSAISGISLSEETYSEAIEILEKRFSNKQILISSNMDQILSISHVESLIDIKNIRHIYDKIESAVRNLKSLKVDIGQYGPVLISIIMNKLPTEIKLQISCIMPATEEWDVTNLLEVLLQEINSRELFCYMGHTNFKQDPSRSDKYENDNRHPIIQRLQCTAAIHVILLLPTLHAHFVSKTTQAQNATL